MHVRHVTALAAVLSFVLLNWGCVTKSTSEPDDPEGKIEFALSPSTIQWIGPGVNPFCTVLSQSAAYGPYAFTLRETGGGTVTINGFTAVTTTTTGAVLLNSTTLIGLLAQDLTGTSGASFTLAANQSLTGPPRYSCQPSSGGPNALPNYPAGANVVFTVNGVDSNNTPVTATATLTLEGL